MTACIGEPISWLRLERHAQDGGVDAAVRDHLAACAACARCLDEIRGDLVALPPLPAPPAAAPARRRLRWWLAPAMTCAAAAAVALVVWRGGAPGAPGARDLPALPALPEREAVSIKGIGEVVLGVVRERAGTVRDDDARTYAPGDRWKVTISCPPATAWIDVTVHDAGQIDRPLPPARVGCGNRVALPGAFSLSGGRPIRVCARVRADVPGPDAPTAPPDACVTLRPE